MNWLRHSLIAAAITGSIVAGGIAASPAHAVDFSFTGSFSQDDEVQLFNFSIGATSTVTLRSYSYAGGTNAAGQTIARGGFDPILALFDSTGLRIGENDDGGDPLVPADAVTGRFYDTFLLLADLPAGDYTVSVMQYDNFSIGPNLSNGFTFAGAGNFRSSQNCAQFADATGDCRNGNWAFDILNVNQAVVVATPEPATLAILGAGLLGLAGIRRRRA
jgi:hypothetical protein